MPTMSVNAGDIDNDGDLDLHLGTGWMSLSGLVPDLMYANFGTRFEDVTESTGTHSLGDSYDPILHQSGRQRPGAVQEAGVGEGQRPSSCQEEKGEVIASLTRTRLIDTTVINRTQSPIGPPAPRLR
jgi:hypothetical protein